MSLYGVQTLLYAVVLSLYDVKTRYGIQRVQKTGRVQKLPRDASGK